MIVIKMSIQRNFVIERICRTCMKEEQIDCGAAGSSNLQSIYDFSNLEQSIRIAELLTTTTPQLLIQPMDNLPKLICSGCVEKLLSVRQFQLMCIHSEQRMRNMLECSDVKYTQFPELSIPLMIEDTRHEDPLQGDAPLAANDDIQDFLKLEMNDKETDVDVTNSALKQRDLCKLNETQAVTGKSDSLEVKNEGESESDTRFSCDVVRNVEKNDDTTADCFAEVESVSAGAKQEVQNSDEGRDEDSLEDSLPPKPEGYKCEKCPRRFAKQKSLITHKKSHTETTSIESYACDLCFKKFKRSHALTKHKQTHRNLKAEEGSHKPYVCQYCDKAFQQSCTLKDHLRTHTGEQPFLCSECGKAFNSSSNMKQHLLRHSGLKRYECPDCPKKFPCLSDLASHKAVHRKFKPHICDICNASFGKPYQLKKHKMYHNGEKPHKCEYCEMRFVCADHMRRHMRTHTGEKPYKCKYCDRAFAQSNDLIKHLRSHLGENVYKCELCPKAFRLATELRQHFVEHKNDDEETREKNFRAMIEEEEKLKISLKM